MSIRSETDQGSNISARLEPPRANFSHETVPYLVSSTDALVILLASVFGAVFYHWVSETPVPDLNAYFALGLIASFIHIARQGGQGYYDFERVATPFSHFCSRLEFRFPAGLFWFLSSLHRPACWWDGGCKSSLFSLLLRAAP